MTEEPPTGSCPNCGHRLVGPYCSACGQAQRDLDRPLRELWSEALSSFLAFDSRVGHTLSQMARRPGELTLEFFRGRRARYVNPFKLYLVASLVLFVTLSLTGASVVVINESETAGGGAATTTVAPVIATTPTPPASPAESAGTQEPSLADTTSWDRFLAKLARIAEDDPGAVNAIFIDRLATSVVVLVPVFALLLRLLHRRSRYILHLVLSLHLHAFAFLVLACGEVADAALRWLVDVDGLAGGLAVVLVMAHVYRAFRRVYGHRRWRTLGLMAALALGYLVALVVTLVATMIATVLLY